MSPSHSWQTICLFEDFVPQPLHFYKKIQPGPNHPTM
jgi:hypothetical protein